MQSQNKENKSVKINAMITWGVNQRLESWKWGVVLPSNISYQLTKAIRGACITSNKKNLGEEYWWCIKGDATPKSSLGYVIMIQIYRFRNKIIKSY